jgi:hypothetical protein
MVVAVVVVEFEGIEEIEEIEAIDGIEAVEGVAEEDMAFPAVGSVSRARRPRSARRPVAGR